MERLTTPVPLIKDMWYSINMARNKTFARHTDSGGFTVDVTEPETLYGEAVSASGDESQFRRSFAGEGIGKPFQKFSKEYYYRRQRPNFNDPYVLFHLLDALVYSAPGHYIRAAHLATYLNLNVFHYYWTPDNVGRMLAGIYEVCERIYYEEDGEPVTDELDMEYCPREGGYSGEKGDERKPISDARRFMPVAMGRDGQGKYYVIDPMGTWEGRMWLVKFRWLVGKRCQTALQGESNGLLGIEMLDAIVPRDAFYDLSPEPISSAQAYRSQRPQPGYRRLDGDAG